MSQVGIRHPTKLISAHVPAPEAAYGARSGCASAIRVWKADAKRVEPREIEVSESNVVLCAAVRAAIAHMGGTLKGVLAPELGAVAIRGTPVRRANRRSRDAAKAWPSLSKRSVDDRAKNETKEY